MRELVIDPRFTGPSDRGHGGYASGLLANVIGGIVETTLRRPVPLGRPLPVVERGDGGIAALDSEQVVLEAHPATLDLRIPEPISIEEAKATTASLQNFEPPPEFFAKCFVCGADRPDGLGVVARPIADRKMVASPWTPPKWVADMEGSVRPEFLWAVLDCPAYFVARRGGSHRSACSAGSLLT